MPRKVRDSKLESRAARNRLPVAHKPYYRLIEPGLHLGFRKLASGPGTWIVRRYSGEGRYAVENLRAGDGALIIADDYSEADGRAVLTFAQAQERAKVIVRPAADGDNSGPTVGDAVKEYARERDARELLRRGRKRRSDASQRLGRYVVGQAARGSQEVIGPAPLAAIRLHDLDDTDLREWRRTLPDTLKATTKQRLVNDLKAALNAYYLRHRKHLPTTLPATIRDALKAEGNSGQPMARDDQVLPDVEIGRLLRAARQVDDEQDWGGDLFRLVVLLAATGARFSQVVRMTVADVQPEKGRVLVPFSRKGKNRTSGSTAVPVGQDVIDALHPATVRRSGADVLLERWRHQQVRGNVWERAERGPWRESAEMPWDAIKERAGMPDVIPYAFRHSSIVRGIRQNLPIRLVAALHDTSVAMIEKHYSRFIVDGLQELAARAVVPLVPQDGNGRVVPLRGR